MSSATLPAAALSQWRLLLCCLSVSGGGAAGMKSVSLDPQVTPSCSSPTRELTPAEWKIKPLLIYDYTSSSLILRWICFGWFLDNEWEHRGHFVFFMTHLQQEDIDKALANILTKITLNHYFLVGHLKLKCKIVSILLNREISDMTMPKTAQFIQRLRFWNTLEIIGSFFITYESQEAISL